VNPDDPVGALVERTLANLRILDELSSKPAPGKPFEVTQLVNSLLSLLVVPRELGTVEFVGRVGHDPHVYENGIRKWHATSVSFNLKELGARPPQNLKKLLGGLRNSVAHAAFKFQEDDDSEIVAIEFIHRSRTGADQWSATFDVEELRRFLGILAVELKSAREYQLARPGDRKPSRRVAMSDVEFQLPTATFERIQGLVRAGDATSVGKFLEDAAAAKLLEDEEISAA
jgi:hypothetical protein